MKGNYYVYVLVLADQSMLKIGMSRSIIYRTRVLTQDWGGFDQEKSFLISCKEETVKMLEKLLHEYFEQYRLKNLKRGDGYTEFFDIKSYSEVVDFVNSLVSQNKEWNICSVSDILKNLATENELKEKKRKERGQSKSDTPKDDIKVVYLKKFPKEWHDKIFDLKRHDPTAPSVSKYSMIAVKEKMERDGLIQKVPKYSQY